MKDDMHNHNRKYWRSLDQLADTPEFRKYLEAEFPDRLDRPSGTIARRDFLSLMGASLALAGLAGCRRPVEKIVPYVTQPEEVVPGTPEFYATSRPSGLSAEGILVASHEGRPTKIEGNPGHPATRGATDPALQAEILNLYDPDRSGLVKHDGNKDSLDNFVTFWRQRFEYFTDNEGRGLALLCEPFSSPTLAERVGLFRKRFPQAHLAAWEPLSDENAFRAVSESSRRSLRPLYHYDRAEIIVALDCDFLATEIEHITAAREFASGRRRVDDNYHMNRLYAVESNFTLTGAMADHRYRLPASHIGHFALALAETLNQKGLNLPDLPRTPLDFDPAWLNAVASDLLSARGRCLLAAGYRQPVDVHKLLLLINDALANLGRTVTFVENKDNLVPNMTGLEELRGRITDGSVDTLVILGGNPVYDAPRNLDMKSALGKIEHTIHFSALYDETSRETDWHIPRAHFLESWGDTRAADGTLGIIQPLIAPLHGGYADAEMFTLLATGRNLRGYDIVRETWKKILGINDFEKRWRHVLHDGFHADSTLPEIKINLRGNDIGESLATLAAPPPDITAAALEITFCPSRLHDGRFANNGWLQELPDPITKLTWDNAALISPRTARDHDCRNGDIVRLEYDSRTITIPVWIVPGQADNSITLPLGYGRRNLGRTADNAGTDVYPLRTTDALHMAAGARLTRTGRKRTLADTQDHGSMNGRPIIREADLAHYEEHPHFAAATFHEPLRSIYPPHDYSRGNQWGMVIDLNLCLGCHTCTIACQAENNIQVVGRDEVSRGREMHWLRTDRYFEGDPDDPRIVFMPVPCQQCENAPCESVCPVAATVHDSEGLNNMTYNRCIGTRYCSNNCPYKVRRFNFFNYLKDMPEIVKMAQNPDVTVRSRGVMEKCTFCIQRIKRAQTAAGQNEQTLADGDVQTACQQACPTGAISFGDLNDPDSTVSRLKKSDRNYDLLAEYGLNTRNSYLARIRNPHPDLNHDKNDKT